MENTVLIADHDVDLVQSMQSFFSLNGYKTAAAHDGEEALSVARTVFPRCIFLDLPLPKIHGCEVARRLRQFADFQNSVIVAYTALSGPKHIGTAREAGMDYYLQKPAYPQILLACIEPTNHASVLAQSSIIAASISLRGRSAGLISKAQALSERSSQAVKHARETARIAAQVRARPKDTLMDIRELEARWSRELSDDNVPDTTWIQDVVRRCNPRHPAYDRAFHEQLYRQKPQFFRPGGLPRPE